jgi:acyl dehydratase
VSLNLALVGVEREPVRRTWDSDDAILYALGVGVGIDGPCADLEFSTETGIGPDQQVLPTFASVLVPGRLSSLGGVPLSTVVHGEESIEMFRALPVTGDASIRSRVDAIRDKGHAGLIEISADIEDAATGAPLARVRSALFVRGAGGFGGDRGAPAPEAPPRPPERPADAVCELRTRPEQALLYRLSGDRNPLHADPDSARRSGFDYPILHGLCTWGFTGRAALATLCGGQPARLTGMTGRFSNIARPGDILTVHFWDLADGRFAFRTYRSDGVVVIDRGLVTISPGSTSQKELP